MSSVPFFIIFIVAIVSYALARGAAPERATASAFILAAVGSLSVGFLHMPGQFQSVPLRLFIVDGLLLVGMTVIAIRANRWWPIPVAGCQLIAVLVHAGKLLDPAMIPNGYAFLVKISSWPMVALLGYGTWAHRTRLRRGIIIPGWKPSSRRRPSPIRSVLQAD
jgi:hypothetical protein